MTNTPPIKLDVKGRQSAQN